MRNGVILPLLAGLCALFLLAPAMAAQAPCAGCPSAPAASAGEAEAFFGPGGTPPQGGMMQEQMAGRMQARMQGAGMTPGGVPGCCGSGCSPRMQGGRMPMMGGGMGPGMAMEMGPGGWEGGGAEPGLLGVADLSALKVALALTDAQVEQLRAIVRPMQKEAVTLAAKMKVAEMELLDLLAADKPDLKAVEARIRESEAVRSQLRLGRVAAWQKAKAVLTPEQLKRLDGLCLTPCGKPCSPADCGQTPSGGPGMPGMMP